MSEIALGAKPGRIEIDFSDGGIPFDPLAQDAPGFDQPWRRGGPAADWACISYESWCTRLSISVIETVTA